MRIFGVSEFAARLPSALAALLAVLCVAWTALRAYGVRAAWFSLLMLPASVAMIGFARAASPDMLFAGLLTAAMAIAIEILQKPRPGPLLHIAFGVILGAAVLAKGPAAVILAGGATLLWAALSRRWTAPFQFLHPRIVAVFCAVALPWYVLCSLRNPDFFRVFILQHNFARYLTPVFEHRQPFWFYVPILCLATTPWIVVLAHSFFQKWNRNAWTDSPSTFVLCWAAFPLLFFSFSQSKLPGYILPSIPPLFFLMSRVMERLFARKTRAASILTGITGAIFIVATVLSEKALLRNGQSFHISSAHVISLVAIIAVGGVVAAGLSLWNQPRTAFTTIVLIVVCFVLFLNFGILPAADAGLSARKAAADALRLNPAMKNIALSDLKRDWHYEFNYYFSRELPEWAPGTPPPEWLLTSEKNAIELERMGSPVREVSRVGAPFAVLLHVAGPNQRAVQ